MAIHVFEKANNLKVVGQFNPAGGNIWDSYAWTISEANANSLIGDNIYLHAGKKKLSRFGGTIQSWYRDANGDVVFRFADSPLLQNIAPPKHWPRQDWVIV